MKKRFAFFTMHLLYYSVFLFLAGAILFPHMTIFCGTRFWGSFIQRVNSKNVYLISGEKYQIHCFPFTQRVSYQTYDFRIASVTSLGMVLAGQAGTTAIKVKSKGEVYKFRVYVFKMNKSRICLMNGQKIRLSVKNGKGIILWKSMDRRIASVNRFGVVEGKKTGITWIFARVKGKTVKCKVTVR